jgi:hypothetical protein
MLPVSTLYHLSGFHECLLFLESCLPSCRHQHSFQKGGNILTLITFTVRSLGWHRENLHFSLIPLTPITFNFNKLSCYGGSYYATITVVSYQPKTSEFIRPSMPTSHRQFLQSSLPHLRVCSPFRTVIYRYQSPLRPLVHTMNQLHFAMYESYK